MYRTLGILDQAVVRDDRDARVLGLLEGRQDRLVVLREQDQDLGALRDQRVDVGQLLLELRFASALMYLPPPSSTVFFRFGLVVRRPARLLEVVPRHADGAAGSGRGRPARGRARCWGCFALPLRTSGDYHHERRNERRQSSYCIVGPPPCALPCPSRNERRCPARLPPSLSRKTSGTHVARPTVCLLPVDRSRARPSCTGELQGLRRGASQPAGSASSGSNASSAAPSSGASTPSIAGTTRTSPRGAGSARRSSSCSSAGPDERMDPPEQAAEHDRAPG